MKNHLRPLFIAAIILSLSNLLLPVSSAKFKGNQQPVSVAATMSQKAPAFAGLFRVAGFTVAALAADFVDIAVTKDVNSPTAVAGGNLTYTIAVINNSPDAADGVTLSDALPAGTTFVSLIPPAGWTCSPPAVGAGGSVNCTNPSFAAMSNDVFTLVVQVDQETPPDTFITNIATVSSVTPDVNDENNSATATSATAGMSADLSVSKEANSDEVTAGANLTYTIRVGNTSANSAANAILSDPLPGGMTFVSLTMPGGWTCSTPAVGSGGSIDCTNPSFSTTSGVVFTLVVNVPQGTSAGTTFTNTATVNSSSSDSNEENNSSNVTTTVVDCAANPVVSSREDDNLGSLRQAIRTVCPGGVITFDPTGSPYTIALTSGPLLIDKDVTITGPAAAGVTISGSNISRVFQVKPGVTVAVSNLNIADGRATDGGGVYNEGTLFISNSALTNNKAQAAGGAIYNSLGVLTVINSTISGNTADTGGGLDNAPGASTARLTNVTVTNNRADAGDNNPAVGSGGGISQNSSPGNPMVLTNTIIAGNFVGVSPSTTPDDVSGSNFDPSSSNNLIGINTGLSGINNGVNGNQVGAGSPLNAMLGALSYNGGPTPSHVPLPGSPAINAGSNARAVNQNNAALATDQRGTGFPRIINSTVDIGSIEVNYAVSATAGTPQHTAINTAFATQLKATVTESGAPLAGIPVTFTAPSTGPSGTFAGGGTTVTVKTDANGVATAPIFTANNPAGGPYNVTAGLTGVSTTANFALTNDKGTAVVTLGNLNQTYDGTPKSVTVVTNPSGLSVVVTYDGSTTPPTNAGTYQVVATVSDANYQGVANGTLNISKAGQTINFAALPAKTFGDPDFTVSATATSNLPVSFSAAGNCTVNGATVHITGAGSCTITASQSGDANRAAATPVNQSFNIAKAPTTTTLSSTVNPSDVGQSVTFTATVTSAAPLTPTGAVQFKIDGSDVGTPVTLNASGIATLTIAGLAPGSHTVVAVYSGDADFAAGSGTLSGGQTVRNQPGLSINDVTMNEGNSGTTAFNFTVTLSTPSNLSVSVNYATADGTAAAPSDYQTNSGTLTFNPGETVKTVTVLVNGDTLAEANETFFVNLSSPVNTVMTDAQGLGTILSDEAPLIQFSSSAYSINEDGLRVFITVNRLGDLSSTVRVDYATSDSSGLNNCDQVTGIASSRCDYATTIGTLRFAAGESSKVISIPIVNDAHIEGGSEVFTIALSNPLGAELGTPSSATITITDADTGLESNPIDGDAFFVRQLYIDFLGREPEPGAVNNWLGILNHCAVPTDCDRSVVAQGFVRSAEFRDRGYFVYRFYSATLGRMPLYSEFIPDMAKASGFLSDQDLEANKLAYIAEFMNRQEFKNLYDSTLNNPTAYVDKLLSTAGLPNHPKRAEWIAGLTNNTLTRAQVLRQFIESSEVFSKYYNESFIVMNYFGFLRRNPDAAYQEWIRIFNQSNDDRVIINGFINSQEYRFRFGH
jgi:uncharacterized repeat protein (TIGR01451 family)